jgi:ketosteroid isomerase-like protein|tara:strand:- start:398 stop:883 length:486 start_codon:yes stop_codon:yes gene_type:complete
MNKYVLILIISFLVSCSNNEDNTQRQENIEIAQAWMDNLFIHSDLDAAKSLMHEDFTFVYMGIIEPGGVVHGKDGFIDDYLPIVGELLPAGIVLTTIDVIADEDGVALIQVGDSKGINGEYDNKYVFTFKMDNGLIHAVKEYNSDLLVATRLYRNELIPLN